MTHADDFIRDEFFTLSLLGALGRSGLWKKDVPERDRKRVHRALELQLQTLSEQYRSPVSEAVHFDNIRALSDGISAEYASLFRDGRFRIGLAQKALNLYLKYLWCAGFAARPPHCPVDAIILESAGIRAATPWTRLDSIEEYARLIEALRAIARGRPLAEWELEVWSQQKARASLPRPAASRTRWRNPPQDAS